MVLQLLRSRLLESFSEVDQLNPASKRKHAEKTSKHRATFSFHPKKNCDSFFFVFVIFVFGLKLSPRLFVL